MVCIYFIKFLCKYSKFLYFYAGNWKGRRLSTGSVGTFPFNHVKFIDEHK